uniref:Fibrillin 1 n=1 Tax=Pongo abelii TaxID=9601 RepID=A0A8I5TL03_PONAB
DRRPQLGQLRAEPSSGCSGHDREQPPPPPWESEPPLLHWQGPPEVGAAPGEGGRSPARGTGGGRAGPRRRGALQGAAAAADRAPGAARGGGSRWRLGIMRRGGLLEIVLGFTVLLASYTSHGADANLEAGNVKETRASRAKRRGGGGHDALKG